MKSVVLQALAVVTLGLCATSGHAANLDSASASKLGFATTTGTFETTGPSGNAFTLSYDTGDNRQIAGRAEFTVSGGPFRLSVGDLSFAEAGSGIYALEDVTNGGFLSGEAGDNFGGCSNRFPGLSVNMNCRRLGTGQGTDPASSGDVLFSNLAAGTYAFLFYEGDSQSESGSFELVVTAVPTPAAGLLFGSALVGAAYLRRRKGLQL